MLRPRPILARWTPDSARTGILAISSVSFGAASGSSCCGVTLIPLAVYVYSDRLTKSFQATTIIQVQSTATDAGLYLDEGAAEQPGEHRQDCRARRHERGGGSGRQAVGRTRGLASRFAHRPGRRQDRVHHNHRHGGQRRAGSGDREHGRPCAEGDAWAGRGPRGRYLHRQRRAGGPSSCRAVRSFSARSSPSAFRVCERFAPRRARTPRSSSRPPRRRPRSPPNPRRNAILAFVVALLIAAGAVALAERLDRRLHDSRDLERLTGTPLLAQVPASAFPGSAPDPQLPVVFQTLRGSLTYFNVDQRLASLPGDQPAQGRRQDQCRHQPGRGLRPRRKAGHPGRRRPSQPSGRAPHGHTANPGLSEVISESTPGPRRLGRHRAVRLVPACAARRLHPAEPLGDARIGAHVHDPGRALGMSDLVLIDSPRARRERRLSHVRPGRRHRRSLEARADAT